LSMAGDANTAICNLRTSNPEARIVFLWLIHA
jgi:hypothetical protein